MPAPTPYSLSYDFTSFQTSNPTTPLPADKVEIEYNNISTTTDEIIANLALIQRSDGALANGIVGEDQLAPAILAVLGAGVGEISTLAALDTEISALYAIRANITTVAGVSGSVATVAGIASNVSTVAGMSSAIATVNSNTTNINTVAGINANVTAVAGIASNVSTVAGISANVTAVAGISASVTTVATNIADVGSVATNIANVNTVAGMNASHISSVASVAGSVETVAGIASNVSTVAGISANVTAVAGISASVTTVATNIASVSTVAGIAADVSDVALNMADVEAVSSGMFNVSVVAGIASNVTTVAGISGDIGILADIQDGTLATGAITTVASISDDVQTVASMSSNIATVVALEANLNALDGVATRRVITSDLELTNNDFGAIIFPQASFSGTIECTVSRDLADGWNAIISNPSQGTINLSYGLDTNLIGGWNYNNFWTKTGITTVNNPSGSDFLGGPLQSHSQIVEDSSTGVHMMSQEMSVSSNNIQTHSGYIKAGGTGFAHIVVTDVDSPTYTNGIKVAINLTTGVMSNDVESGTGEITSFYSEDMGNGWYRFVLTGRPASTNTTGVTCLQVRMATTATVDNYAGTGTNYLNLWGIATVADTKPIIHFVYGSVGATPTLPFALNAGDGARKFVYEKGIVNSILIDANYAINYVSTLISDDQIMITPATPFSMITAGSLRSVTSQIDAKLFQMYNVLLDNFGVETLIDGFETLNGTPIPNGLAWTNYSNSVTWSLDTAHNTQGTYASVATGLASSNMELYMAEFSSGSAAILGTNISNSFLKLDLYIDSIGANDFVTMTLTDDNFDDISVSSSLGQTGLVTLTLNLLDKTFNNACAIQIKTNEQVDPFVIHLDNLRKVALP